MPSPAELAELEDGGEISIEDTLVAQMEAKAGGKDIGITFVAFTATPKDKTLQLDKSAALKGIMGWVRQHEYNIAQRVGIVVEHFTKHVAPLLGGAGKAMVVTASRGHPRARTPPTWSIS